MWQGAVDEAQVVARYTFDGGRDTLTFRYNLIDSEQWAGRLVAAAVYLSLIAAAAYLLRRGTLSQCFARWPHAFGIVLGLAWWLWLWPGVIGLLIVLLVLLHQFIPRPLRWR